jgi:hypothetical protein
MRAFFARSDVREDKYYQLMISTMFGTPEDDVWTCDITRHTFNPEIRGRRIHDSVFTTLTADAYAAELLRRERFPQKTDIIVRLHGLVGAAHLNGREGALRGRDPSNSERCTVRLDSANWKDISVRPQNCETVRRPKLLNEEF